MKKPERDAFVGFYDNGTYRVGCSGATVYVFDRDGNERGRFRDFPYAYHAAFMPGRNIIAVKSTGNALGFYDLDSMTLLKRHRMAFNGCQDDGFAFSPDGTRFYNIERVKTDLRTQLCIFETEGFTKICTLFADDVNMVLADIEIDPETGNPYLLGFMRDPEKGYYDHGFIAILDESAHTIADPRTISKADYDRLSGFKDWERAGFTEKASRFNFAIRDIEPILSLAAEHKLSSDSLKKLLPPMDRDAVRPVSIKELYEAYASPAR